MLSFTEFGRYNPMDAARMIVIPERSRDRVVPSGSRSAVTGDTMADGPIFKFARSCGEPRGSAFEAALSRALELSNKVRL